VLTALSDVKIVVMDQDVIIVYQEKLSLKQENVLTIALKEMSVLTENVSNV
jgi:hypothetical protein